MAVKEFSVTHILYSYISFYIDTLMRGKGGLHPPGKQIRLKTRKRERNVKNEKNVR